MTDLEQLAHLNTHYSPTKRPRRGRSFPLGKALAVLFALGCLGLASTFLVSDFIERGAIKAQDRRTSEANTNTNVVHDAMNNRGVFSNDPAERRNAEVVKAVKEK